MSENFDANNLEGIAIIGMAGRFPGAKNIQEFWDNLAAGAETISFFSDEELSASGVGVASIKNDPTYVRARGILPDADLFDAAFFGINPREAELMDPQHRLMLECAWETLETAGYDPETCAGSVGVYAGMSKNTYFLANLYPNRSTIEAVDSYLAEMGNEKDYLTTRISYKLNLTGPSVSLHTACSTSLVAVFHACQGLLNYQCDLALAGGVSVKVPQKRGYWYQEGDISSPDGHCRAFDEHGRGTVFSNGVAMVGLKRLAEAVRDGDNIYAVIKGVAINNDGSSKVSFGAPSVDGQAEVIAMAQALAEVEPETISYVEGHGTATPLGDPIEVAALTQAFRAGTAAKTFCALGSVKSNVGHLDAAAGVTGLIKTALALKHKLLLPSLHFKKPNPKFDLENTPFYINTELKEWKAGPTPRRAGVSSFGTGGTNAHAVLEEAPPSPPSDPARSWQLLLLSAKTETALETATANLLTYLKAQPDSNLADVAYTLQRGRRAFAYRRMLVCRDLPDALSALESLDPKRVVTRVQERRERPVVFMFPGQGSQYVNMGRELYQSEPVFRQHVDRCAEILLPLLGLDLRHVLYPNDAQIEAATRQLKETAITQPAIFVVEYALAKLWLAWGIRPERMIGHSIGEFVAACLAGVFSVEDALILLAARGRLMQDLPDGAMLAVPLPEAELAPLLDQDLSLAAVNGPSSCVVSGSREAVGQLEQQLAQREVASRHLHTSHAFHSPMMDPILEAFTVEVSQVKLNPPRIPFISSPTGTWITPAEATEPAYWARHLRQTVRFAEGRRELAKMPDQVLLEVGPGSTLASLAKHPAYAASEQIVLSSLGHVLDNHQDLASILHALGQLWLAGVAVDWAGYYAYERRQRLALPTYPFERQRYWIDPPQHENHGDLPTPTVNDNFEVQLAAGKAAEILPEIPHEKEMAMLETGSSPNGIPARKERILAELKSTMHDIGGLNPAEIDGQATFLELGFDSLFLTQASLAFKKKFAVKITFRQLLEDTSTLKALADYIDGQLPPEALPAEPAPPPLVTANRPETSTPARPAPFSNFSDELQRVAAGNGDQGAISGSALERVINQQLQLMAKQLEALRYTAPPLHESLPDQKNRHLEPANGQVNSTPLSDREAGALTQAADRETHETKRFGPWKPINQSALSGLDLRQQKHLADLISRYTARTRQSKQLTQTHRPHLADPRSVSGFRTAWKELVYPIVAVRSSGSKLWDVDGNEYVDVQSGFGSVFFGHSPEFIRQAVEEQLKLGVQIGPQSPLAGEVAKLICEFSGMERVTFCNTGSEAVLAALRVARTVTGRTKIAMFAHDYHGIFDEVLGRSIALGRGSRVVPIAPGILPQMVENVLLLEYGDPNSLDLLREHAGDLAAVLVEPVQSRHPDLQPREFLHELRAWTEQAEILLIFDEVVTGFRLHPGGAQAWFGVQADLVTYGKIVGGGMPLGILAGKATFMDALDGGMWTYGDASFPEVGVTYFAGTFVRHPLALAAASAVLNRLKLSGPELQQRLNETASRFARELNEYFEQRHAPLHLEQCASMLYLKFLEESEFSSLLFFYLREKGVHILEGGSFFLTTAHTDADLALVRQAIKESVAEMQEAGFLPGSLSEFSPRESAQLKFPLTEGQMEIWLASQMGEAASRAFNEAFTLRLQGPLKVEHLREAVQTVIARHEALHVRFSPSGDYQERMTPASLDICLQDCSTLAAVVKEATVAEILKKEASETFDLINGPLWRAQILKLEAEEVLFIFSAHHIVFDGWSAGVLLHEIGLVYSALCQRQPYRLPEPTSFVAYATAEAEAQASPEVAQTYQYWLDQFADLPSPLDLPTDRPRPAMKSYSGGTVKRTFKPEVAQALKRTAAAQGVTLFTMLLAAYNLLLSRLTGQEDIVVGVSAAGQAMTGQAPLVGHCVNLLPLRSRLDSEASFKDFLASIRIAVLDAYDHQQCTFGSILQRLKLGRDPSHLPLVQATFNLDPDLVGHGFHGLAASMAPVPKQAVNFDIFFNINEGQGGLTANCHYNTDLFDEETISRWLGHYETLLEDLAANPDQDLSALPLLSETERNHLLVTLNQTHRPFPNDKCIHHLFEAQVERSPHAIAVIFPSPRPPLPVSTPDEHLTYQALNRRANQLAHYLQALGVGPDVLVAVYMDRSLEMVIALLAILKAGGAYVPLDPAYPPERLAFMLADTQAAVVLTQARLAGSLPAPKARVIRLDSDWERIARESVDNPLSPVSPDQLAYVIYTSGSTGQPKGTMIPHHALCNHMAWMQQEFSLTETDHVLQKTPFSFDASVWEFYAPLLTGARLIMAQPEGHKNPAYLVEIINQYQITTLQLVPSLLRVLLEEPAFETCTSLKRVFCGGEVLSIDLQERFFSRLAADLYNLYGPTEATIDATCWACQRGSNQQSVPIGRPIANTCLYLLDSTLQPVPIGVPGELYISGAGLARGYLNQPQLTEEKFIPNPFSPDLSPRLYKTGDLARYLPDGNLEFLGRIDHQVKIRGFRIELEEIEAILGQHPAIRQAVAVVREGAHRADDKHLVAYIVSNQKPGPTINELRRFLKDKLPEYMLPSTFVTLDNLPLTPNGKVNRRALPAPDTARPELEEAFAPPQTPIEQELAAIWAEILDLERVGIHDNFFDLGGYSLQAMRVIARVRASFQVELPLRTLFETPTVAGLAWAITQILAEQEEDEDLLQMIAALKDLPEEAVQTLLQDEINFNRNGRQNE